MIVGPYFGGNEGREVDSCYVVSKWYVRGDSDIRGGREPEGIMSDESSYL